MSKIIQIPTHIDNRGSLSVIDDLLPFEIKRVYYVYKTTAPRGGHSHKYSSTFLIAINGKVNIRLKNNDTDCNYELNSPNFGLLVNPGDWISFECSNDGILLCLSSHAHNKDDYVYDI